MAKSPVIFVLPGDGRSGGVRVTVIMANLLIARGYDVRIACPHGRETLRSYASNLFSKLAHGGAQGTGFLHLFKGRVEKYRQLDDLNFSPGEIVIAVGTYSVPDVRSMTKPVIKLRFNHGFPAKPDALQEQAWRGKIPTITVSNTLVPRLQELTEGSVLGVVPNGIDTSEYFVEPGMTRDGIGALYNGHPNKAPEDMISVLRDAHQKWPLIPQHVFGTERLPPGLAHANYARLPPVAEARKIYNSSKVWLLTSRTEGLPGVVMEAMACGCVVISTDNEGSLEILRHGENGLIVRRGDLPAFLQQIEQVFADKTLVAKITAGAKVTIEQFTWNRAGDKMEQVLKGLSLSNLSKEQT